MTIRVTSATIARTFPLADLSALATSDQGSGRVWKNAGFLAIGDVSAPALDAAVVHKEGAETIEGAKRFSAHVGIHRDADASIPLVVQKEAGSSGTVAVFCENAHKIELGTRNISHVYMTASSTRMVLGDAAHGVAGADGIAFASTGNPATNGSAIGHKTTRTLGFYVSNGTALAEVGSWSSTGLTVGGTLSVTGNTTLTGQLTASNQATFASAIVMSHATINRIRTAVGTVQIRDSADAAFANMEVLNLISSGYLRLSNATPKVRCSGTLTIRDANDTADGSLSALNGTFSGTLGVTGETTLGTATASASGVLIGGTTVDNTKKLQVVNNALASRVILGLKGQTGQSGNALEYVNSSDVSKFSVDKDGNITTAGTLTATGAVDAPNTKTAYFGRTIPGAADPNTYVNIGTLTRFSGTTWFRIGVAWDTSAGGGSAVFEVPISFSHPVTGWVVVAPRISTGLRGGEEIALEIRTATTSAAVEIRMRKAGTPLTASTTFRGMIEYINGCTFTPDTTTGIEAATTALETASTLSVNAGKVLVNMAAVNGASQLQVNGQIALLTSASSLSAVLKSSSTDFVDIRNSNDSAYGNCRAAAIRTNNITVYTDSTLGTAIGNVAGTAGGFEARNTGTSGSAWYGMSNASNSTGRCHLQTAGQNRVTIDATGRAKIGANVGSITEGAHLTVESHASAAYDTILGVGMASQSGYLLRLRSDTVSNVFSVTPAGNVALAGTLGVTGAATFTADILASANNTVAVGSAANNLKTVYCKDYASYNVYTGAADYERARIYWASNVFTIGTEAPAGTGTARYVDLIANGANRIRLTSTYNRYISNVAASGSAPSHEFFASDGTTSLLKITGDGGLVLRTGQHSTSDGAARFNFGSSSKTTLYTPVSAAGSPAIDIYSTGSSSVLFTVYGTGNVTTAGGITVSDSFELASKTIATLPSAAASNKKRFLVTDSTPPNMQVFSSGTAWYYEDGTAV